MAADPTTLRALARTLDQRADDLIYIGRRITANAEGVVWSCAKADRYRAAMHAREIELRRVAAQMHELALALLQRAAQAETPAP